VLNHPVAASKIAYALTRMNNSIEISLKLVELLNRKNIENISKLNQVDIFMYIKFLQSQKVKEVCLNSTDSYLNLNLIWQIVV
jgi:hypothetical protein